MAERHWQRGGSDGASGRDRKENISRQGNNSSRGSDRSNRSEHAAASPVPNGAGGAAPQSFVGPFTIGRSRRCDFVIPTSDDTRTISKIHARVYSMPAEEAAASRSSRLKWIVQDLNTLNGTAINGMDLLPGGSFELHDGDEILLSSTMRNGVRLGVQIRESDPTRIIVKPHGWGSGRQSASGSVNATPTPVWRGSHSRGATPPPQQQRLVQAPPSTLAKRPRSAEDRARANGSSGGRASESHDSKRRCRDDDTESVNDTERFMVCSVCLDYFESSATLACSHTFCGHCISHWFRTSATLSCPECRAGVKHMPVRNRALDELVHQITGDSDAFLAAVQKRAAAEQESAVAASAQARDRGFDVRTHPSVFSHWSPEDKLTFSEYIVKQFGDRRLAACRHIGLTEAAIDGASASELRLAAQNLLIDLMGLHASHEANDRIKIYLHYG